MGKVRKAKPRATPNPKKNRGSGWYDKLLKAAPQLKPPQAWFEEDLSALEPKKNKS